MPEKFVVAEIRKERAGDGRRLGETVQDPRGQLQRLIRHAGAARVVQDPRNQCQAGAVQGGLLLESGCVLPREQPGPELPEAAADLDSRVGGRGGQH